MSLCSILELRQWNVPYPLIFVRFKKYQLSYLTNFFVKFSGFFPPFPISIFAIVFLLQTDFLFLIRCVSFTKWQSQKSYTIAAFSGSKCIFFSCRMLSGFVEFDGYYLESDPCLVCNNPEVPFQVWLSLFIEILCSPSSVVFRDFTQHLQEKGCKGEYRIVTENVNVKPHEKCVHYIGTYLVITLSRKSAILTDKIIYFTHNKTIGLRRNICVHTVGSLNTRESREFHLLILRHGSGFAEFYPTNLFRL